MCHLTCDSRAESYSCTSPVLLNRSSPSFSKLYILGACLFSSGSPGWGAPFGPPTPHSLEGTSVLGISLPFVVCQHRGMGLHLSYPSCVVPSFCLQLWKIFSAVPQVVLIDSCSVSSGNFGASRKEMSSGSSYSTILACLSSTIAF